MNRIPGSRNRRKTRSWFYGVTVLNKRYPLSWPVGLVRSVVFVLAFKAELIPSGGRGAGTGGSGGPPSGRGKFGGRMGPGVPERRGCCLPEILLDEVLEPLAPAGMAELAEGLRLDLANAFAGDAELLA